LLKELAYLPLAIVQAAAYVNVNKISLQKYRLLLTKKKKEIVGPIATESQIVIATTWLISFEQIRSDDALAADYLLFMACTDRRDVPLSLLPVAMPREHQARAVKTLDAYSFVTKQTAQSALDLHRLVQTSTRNWLGRQGLLRQQTQVAITRLLEVFPDRSHGDRNKWRRFFPYAKFALSYGILGQDNEARANLTWKYAMALLSDGRFNEADAYFQEAVQSQHGVGVVEHPYTLTSMGNLALTYRGQGRWKEAEELFVQVIETSERVLGEEHPDTLTSMGNLALTYARQGRWETAEELEVQVMKTRKRVLGKEHPSTLTSMNNVASTYVYQGR
jgi:tetratricopeptide (TPR) repeat protein